VFENVTHVTCNTADESCMIQQWYARKKHHNGNTFTSN